MRKILTLLLLLSSLAFSLDWAQNFNKAVKQADKEHKAIMVYVEGKYCGWCKKMKHRTLSDAEVEKRLSQFVLVKIWQNDVQTLSHLPKVNGVPTIFFMESNKKVLEEVVGYFSVEDFLSYIDDVEKKRK